MLLFAGGRFVDSSGPRALVAGCLASLRLAPEFGVEHRVPGVNFYFLVSHQQLIPAYTLACKCLSEYPRREHHGLIKYDPF